MQGEDVLHMGRVEVGRMEAQTGECRRRRGGAPWRCRVTDWGTQVERWCGFTRIAYWE
jgi:hypothetical protein